MLLLYDNHANIELGLSVVLKVFRDRFTLMLQGLRDVSPSTSKPWIYWNGLRANLYYNFR